MKIIISIAAITIFVTLISALPFSKKLLAYKVFEDSITENLVFV